LIVRSSSSVFIVVSSGSGSMISITVSSGGSSFPALSAITLSVAASTSRVS